jgi:hypothetical protein
MSMNVHSRSSNLWSYSQFFSFESFVTRYKLQKTSLKLISVPISDFHFEMPFIESTSKSSSGLSSILSKNASDSIFHYIWLCPVIKLFWNRVKTWLEGIFDIPIELKMANIVFITNVNECPFEIIHKMLFTMIRVVKLLHIVYLICIC